MAAFLRKYATATHIYVPMIKRGVVDFALGADWTPASGDVKVSIDGGAAANIGTLPTAVAMGNTAYWDFTIATGEVTGKKITVTVGDAATKAVEDQMFLIETYGHASAEYQADLSAANLPADAVKIGGTAQTGLDLGGNWTASRASKIDNLDAAISSRSTYAGADTSGTTTLLARLTALRASNLDNLDASISGLNNLSALINIYGAPTLEIPDSSSTSFAFTVVVRDNEGKLVDLDASPTIAAANAAGTSRSANLSAVSHPATGRYTFTYSVSSTDAEESLRITVSGAVSSESRYIEWIGVVVNYDTLTTLNAIKAKTDNLPSSPASTSDCITQAGVRTATGLGAANLDTQLNAIYNVAGLVQAKTDLIPAAPATEGNVTSVGTAVAAVSTKLGTPVGASVSADIAAVKSDTNTLIGRITSTLFSGITYLSKWLGLMAGKTADSGTLAEINATTAGAGYNNTTDSQEAIRDRGDSAWTGGAGGGTTTLVVAPIKAIVPTQTIPSSGTQEFFQYGPLPGGPITVLDANLDPIDLSGKNLKLVMTCNRDTAIAFKLVSGVGGQLTVGGTDSNQVTVDGDSTYTQTAGDFTWNLRDADTDFGYAWGTWRILPMANDVPA